MNLTRNQLKELIRQSIKEIDFKNQAAFDAYNKKHKMRKSTKVNIGGKETTAGEAEGGQASGKEGDSVEGALAKANEKSLGGKGPSPLETLKNDDDPSRQEAYELLMGDSFSEKDVMKVYKLLDSLTLKQLSLV